MEVTEASSLMDDFLCAFADFLSQRTLLQSCICAQVCLSVCVTAPPWCLVKPACGIKCLQNNCASCTVFLLRTTETIRCLYLLDAKWYVEEKYLSRFYAGTTTIYRDFACLLFYWELAKMVDQMGGMQRRIYCRNFHFFHQMLNVQRSQILS